MPPKFKLSPALSTLFLDSVPREILDTPLEDDILPGGGLPRLHEKVMRVAYGIAENQRVKCKSKYEPDKVVQDEDKASSAPDAAPDDDQDKVKGGKRVSEGIHSTDEEAEDDEPPSKKQRVLRNKVKLPVVASTICSAERCKNNPQCLNHMGQDKWESTGALALLSKADGMLMRL